MDKIENTNMKNKNRITRKSQSKRQLVSLKTYVLPMERKEIKEEADALGLSVSNYIRFKLGRSMNGVGRKPKNMNLKKITTDDKYGTATDHLPSTVNFQNPDFGVTNQLPNTENSNYTEASDEGSYNNSFRMFEYGVNDSNDNYNDSSGLPDGLVDDALDELENFLESNENKVVPQFENNVGPNLTIDK
jgi:hypothetical protein